MTLTLKLFFAASFTSHKSILHSHDAACSDTTIASITRFLPPEVKSKFLLNDFITSQFSKVCKDWNVHYERHTVTERTLWLFAMNSSIPTSIVIWPYEVKLVLILYFNRFGQMQCCRQGKAILNLQYCLTFIMLPCLRAHNCKYVKKICAVMGPHTKTGLKSDFFFSRLYCVIIWCYISFYERSSRTYYSLLIKKFAYSIISILKSKGFYLWVNFVKHTVFIFSGSVYTYILTI